MSPAQRPDPWSMPIPAGPFQHKFDSRLARCRSSSGSLTCICLRWFARQGVRTVRDPRANLEPAHRRQAYRRRPRPGAGGNELDRGHSSTLSLSCHAHPTFLTWPLTTTTCCPDVYDGQSSTSFGMTSLPSKEGDLLVFFRVTAYAPNIPDWTAAAPLGSRRIPRATYMFPHGGATHRRELRAMAGAACGPPDKPGGSR